MPKIVISYRRQDSEAITGRIRDRLAGQYGGESVFMDIDSIPFGLDFREQIGDALLHTDILIAIIGTKWARGSKRNRSRIHEENDPVRVEVEKALERGIPVVPIRLTTRQCRSRPSFPRASRNCRSAMPQRWIAGAISTSIWTA
jgi:hypothetical protein